MNVSQRREAYLTRIQKLRSRVANPHELGRADARTEVDAVFAGALNIATSLYGSTSPQIKALMEMHKLSTPLGYTNKRIQSFAESLDAVLRNTAEEIELGLINSIATEAAGVVIGDLVALARTQLKAGYKDVAAVLASAALEDALKRKALELDLAVGNKTLDAVMNALKSKGILGGAQGPIVASYVKLRNAAMHADWSRIAEADVSSLLGFLEPFLLEHFSSPV
ncbi:MAG TPA: hypothetical protein VNA69_05080 [Thermoanaerobaculia bacterium]|nr:hypothetical protein [Thermoanaerobaculia bacterium]